MSQIAIAHNGPDPQYHGGALGQTEYELVEFEDQVSGRAFVANAVMRTPGGEAWMRQLRTLPLYIEPVTPPLVDTSQRTFGLRWWLEGLTIVSITVAWIWFVAWVLRQIAGGGLTVIVSRLN